MLCADLQLFHIFSWIFQTSDLNFLHGMFIAMNFFVSFSVD